MIKLLTSLLITLVSQVAYTQTFHALIVADTQAADVGSGCQKDVAAMTATFKAIASGIGYPLNLVVLSDSGFRRPTIEQRLHNLPIGPKDVAFLYYTGHGHNLAGRTDPFPLLSIEPGNDPSLRSLHDSLRAKHARLTITMADACNIVLPAGTRGLMVNPMLKGGTVEDDINRVLANLFLDQTGDVLIAACQPHQSACMLSDQGSHYTRSWEQALSVLTTTRSRLSWTDLLLDAQARVDRLARPDSSHQTSIYEINLKPIKQQLPPDAHFTAISQYLNALTDERLTYAERALQRQKATQYFNADARVTIYQNDTSVGEYALNDMLKRLTLNAVKIGQVNFIEKRSKRTPNGKLYQTIAIQEVWSN
ncbi:hypothetical protein G8759_23720 [Spirosoma aureum]|uniref:Peptidase C14 caspase domain-containing protein n=1 Tax=Spirosoma aureum TaxID=2692134 RepID=A0A6G9ASV0_9BACT|nr:caspase family protein [Spirosoma aureum]QIP15424.1 hypothetical protein G8759_23720 [Spirosoma aureum]